LWPWSGVAAFFLAAAVVQTWPLILHLSDRLVTWPFALGQWDSWMNLWSMWWVKEALLSGQNPLHTDRIFYPQGTDLQLHDLGAANGVLSIPFQVVTGNLILSWNLTALVLFVLSGLATHALAYRITKNHAAALVAAYVFTFSPFVLMRFHGHWPMSSVWPLPLFALFLIRVQESGRLKEAVAAGAVWAVITYNHQEYATDAATFLGLFAIYWSIVYARRPDRAESLSKLWRAVPVVVVSWMVLSAPMTVPAVVSIERGDSGTPTNTTWGFGFVTDPLALVTPSPLWGPGELPNTTLSEGSNHERPGAVENTVYLGITPLLLGGLALLSVRRFSDRAVFWAAVFLTFTILALGPYLFLGDTKDFTILGWHFSVPLPYKIYDQIPVLGDRRGIARLIVFGHLALAVLAALGTDVLIRRLRENYRKLVPLAATLLLFFVILEYWTPPNDLFSLEAPAVFQAIGDEPGDFSIVHVPLGRATWTGFGLRSENSDYYVTIHGKPTFGGYISRAPLETVNWLYYQPGLRFLACPLSPPHCPEGPSGEDLDVDSVMESFRRYRVKYVALDWTSPDGQPSGGEELARVDSYLLNILRLVPVYADGKVTVYWNRDLGLSSSLATDTGQAEGSAEPP
jgi:hypothetical protein